MSSIDAPSTISSTTNHLESNNQSNISTNQSEYDPKYETIIASLRQQGLHTIADQIIALNPTSTTTQSSTTPPQSTTIQDITPSTQSQLQQQTQQQTLLQQQLEHDLIDYSHLPSVDSFTSLSQSTQPTHTAYLNFSAECKTPFTTFISAMSNDGRFLAIFEGYSICVFNMEEFFAHPAISPTTSSQSTTTTQPSSSSSSTTTSHNHKHNQQRQPNTIPTPSQKWDLPSNMFSIRQMKWNSVENVLIVLCSNNTLLLYTIGHPIPLHIRDIDDISIFDVHPTGKYLLLGSRETPIIKLYDLTTFTCSIPFHTHTLCTTKPTINTSQYLRDMSDKTAINDNNINNTTTNNNQNNINNNNIEYDSITNRIKPATGLYHDQLSIIQSTDLPQFPIYQLLYSNFAQYFAVLTIAPQISPNIPLIQIRIYNTIDHILFNTFNLPTNNTIIEYALLLQRFNPLSHATNPYYPQSTPQITTTSTPNQQQPPIQPKIPNFSPLLDPSLLPISLQWSQNDKFLLVSLPFQSYATTLPNYVYLFNILDGQLIMTYNTTPTTSIPIENNYNKNNNNNKNNFTQTSSTPTPSSSSTTPAPHTPIINYQPSMFPPNHIYYGFKTFFSLDSLYIFVIQTALPDINTTSPITRTDLSQFITIFYTPTGQIVRQVESYFSDHNNTNNNPTSNDINTSTTTMNDNTNSTILKKNTGYPNVIFPDINRHCFYLFTTTNLSFKIDYSFQIEHNTNNSSNNNNNNGN